ncbi:hypothetical protein [Paraglaciecola arctica]|uniref:hypothetical protein n=1 Tax=Paraglaciecola arctica TaxID=1128911 RepID=UPI001C07EDE3|nr:hypothetical protein [Paraglaciecola arctica]MBU3003602.1 hypothetical protein [Paraglaciecola arctica]
MPEKLVKQHYIALLKLLKNYRTGPLNSNLLNATQLFCKNLYAAAKANPDLIFAQPQLYKLQLPIGVNLSFNSAVLTCLLAVRNKFAPSVTLQLMCASVSIYGLEQLSIEEHYRRDPDNQNSTAPKIGRQNTTFIQLLEINQQQLWLSSYQLCEHIHSSHYPRRSVNSPSLALVFIANKLAILCTPKKYSKSVSFAQAVKHLSFICCQKWYALIVPLLEYPSLTPVGSYIRVKDDSVHLVLSISIKGLITKPLASKATIELNSAKAGIQCTSTHQITKVYPCQQLRGFHQLNQWWGTELEQWLSHNKNNTQKAAFDLILPIQNAPASLLVIQDQLSHLNADMALIIKAIEKEPAYAQQLQASASLMNRQKQTVQNTQHGLAMLGYERTNSLLLQFSLLSRLNQQYFPLQPALLTFSQFFINIVSELAINTKITTPELARTTAYFLISRLFTLPNIRTLYHWETSAAPKFSLASLVNVKAIEDLKNSGYLLAKSWQQNESMLEVLVNYDLVLKDRHKKPVTNQYCYLLGSSLILAQNYYFNDTSQCEETDCYLKNGLSELGLNQAKLSNIMTKVVSNSHVFCHFD